MHHPSPSCSAPAVAMANVSKAYGSLRVLSGISLRVSVGEKLVLFGPSGSGKSTLIRCINGLENYQDGLIEVFGVPVDEDARNMARVRRRVGMVFQQFNLFPHMTVLENCVMPQVMTMKRKRDEAEHVAREWLDRVGLAAHASKFPSQISGGQQQRVAISRSLCLRPGLMLFDEPTSSLDPEMVGEVLDVMTELASDGMTMICVTHEMGFARKVADRVAFLDGGKLVEIGEPAELFERPQSSRLATFLSQVL